MPISCASCGQLVADHFSCCPGCNETVVRGAASATRPPPPAARRPDPERLRIDIRAKAMWGEKREVIRTDFLREGHAARDVDRALEEAFKERHVHFRKRGLKDLLMGAGCLLGLAILTPLLLSLSEGGEVRNPRRQVLLWGAAVALPVTGTYLLVRGARRLAGGGEGEGEATELEEEDD